MSAVAALARAEAAGIRFTLASDGTVAMAAAAPPPPGVVVELRLYREDVARLLAARAAMTTPQAAIVPAPPPPASLMRWPGGCSREDTPAPGAWCSCCSRREQSGGRWWQPRGGDGGWRCWPCHPPDHLPASEIVEVRT